MGLPFIVRPAVAKDAETISTIHTESIGHSWSKAAIETDLTDDAKHYLLAVSDDLAFGYLSAFVIAEDEAEILNVAVMPAYRGKGIARSMLAVLFDLLRAEGIKTVYLEVASQNGAAKHLYSSTGFVLIGRRKHYYHNPQDDALLMSLSL